MFSYRSDWNQFDNLSQASRNVNWTVDGKWNATAPAIKATRRSYPLPFIAMCFTISILVRLSFSHNHSGSFSISLALAIRLSFACAHCHLNVSGRTSSWHCCRHFFISFSSRIINSNLIAVNVRIAMKIIWFFIAVRWLAHRISVYRSKLTQMVVNYVVFFCFSIGNMARCANPIFFLLFSSFH